ncbi:MAG: ABC1 kinase family protein [Haemophilus parainfluenzae]
MAIFNKFQRAKQVAEILLRYGLDEFFERSNLEKWLPESLSNKLANESSGSVSVYERIRRAMEELGTTYVKLGQMLSDRRDLLPVEMITELQKLQDKVEVQPIDIAEKFQRELGIDIHEHFETLASEPMASASIGQVFKGRLKNGQDVAVKIKREGIEEVIKADLLILQDLVNFLEQRNDIISNLQPKALLNTFKESITTELSLESERRSIERFANNFKQNPRILVPQTYSNLSNNNILCMDFVYGSKVTNKAQIEQQGLLAKDVALLGLDLYMKQVFEFGFFHADPHPGNILLTPDADCRLTWGKANCPKERELLGNGLHYASKKGKIIETIKQLAVSYNVPNEKALENDLSEIFMLLTESNLAGLNISELMNRFTKIMSENSIIMPEGVYLLAKGFAQIEGIGRYLYPELDIAAVLKPYVTQMLKKRFSPKHVISENFEKIADSYNNWLSLPEEVKIFLQKISNKEIRLEHEIHGLERFRKTVERVGIMLIIAALIIAASILSLNENLPQRNGIPIPSLICGAIALVLAVFLLIKRIDKN